MAPEAASGADESLVVLVTAPSEEKAAQMARTLVDERLAACVNIVAGIRSVYRWEERIQDEREALMVVKTRARAFERLRERILALHDYQCPEIIALPIERGHTPYLEWLGESVP